MGVYETKEAASRIDTMPVRLLTGFLGSGKTTLLNDVPSDPRGAWLSRADGLWSRKRRGLHSVPCRRW